MFVLTFFTLVRNLYLPVSAFAPGNKIFLSKTRSETNSVLDTVLLVRPRLCAGRPRMAWVRPKLVQKKVIWKSTLDRKQTWPQNSHAWEKHDDTGLQSQHKHCSSMLTKSQILRHHKSLGFEFVGGRCRGRQDYRGGALAEEQGSLSGNSLNSRLPVMWGWARRS